MRRWKEYVRDITGREILPGDRVRFFYYGPYERGNIWDGTVIEEQAMLTIDPEWREQVQNPEGWDQEHDWVKSRGASCEIGYAPEYAPWQEHRSPLVSIAERWTSGGERDAAYHMADICTYGQETIIKALILRRSEL